MQTILFLYDAAPYAKGDTATLRDCDAKQFLDAQIATAVPSRYPNRRAFKDTLIRKAD